MPIRGMAKKAAPAFQYQPMFEKEGADENTPWRKLTSDFVSEVEVPGTGKKRSLVHCFCCFLLICFLCRPEDLKD